MWPCFVVSSKSSLVSLVAAATFLTFVSRGMRVLKSIGVAAFALVERVANLYCYLPAQDWPITSPTTTSSPNTVTIFISSIGYSATTPKSVAR